MTCILSCHWSLCVYLPFSPGRAPQSPPSNVYKRGGLGGLLGFGWVGASKPQNPPAPYKHSLLLPPLLSLVTGALSGCLLVPLSVVSLGVQVAIFHTADFFLITC